MKFSESTDFKYSTVVRHQGASIVLALNENCDIYYRVLALDPMQPEDDKCWSDSKKLALPDQIRPSGMSLVTVKLKTAEQTADIPFQAVSDGKHVYLFRQSIDCTLYVDRFIFDPAQKTLNPNWEPRFQRSCKRDIPDSRKDTTGAMGMEGEPFFEPTTELTIIKDLQDGRFSVLLLAGRLPSEWRWQIFATNSKGEIDSFSIRRGEDGLFDMSDVKQTCFKWADKWDQFQTGPAALMYMQQEDVLDENGRKQRFKRGARVMLAAPVGSSKYALELDGVDDFVCLGNPENLQIQGAITIEAWVKIQDKDKEQYIVAHGTNGVCLKIDSGKYQFGYHDKCASFDIPEDDINTWVHLAGVYDNEQQAWILYRNGNEVNRYADSKGFEAVKEDWMIGRSFKGQINNVRLWNVARSANEIQDNMYQLLSGQEPGLAGYWPIDEGSGEVVCDVVANNHGQLDLGHTLNFDGIDDYVDVADNPSLTINQAITVEARIKHLDGDGHIVNRGGGWSDSGYSLFIYKGNIRVELQDTNRIEKTIVDNPLPTDGTWHQLTFTWDSISADIKTYIDGKLQPNTGKFTGPIGMPDQKLNIGRNEKHGNYFHGSIDKVCLWNVARTQEEIQQGMDVPPAGDESGLVGYWPFDERSGDIVRDVVSENNGQLHLGYAIHFDGFDDYVELSDMEHKYDNGFTVEAWVRFSDFKKNSRIIDFGNGSPQDNIIFANHYDSRNLVFQVYQGTKIKEIKAPDVLQENEWMHLAASVDPYGNAALYKDGIQLITGTINVPAYLNRTKNYIGRSNWVEDEYFSGDMKEVRIWNVARTQEEIQRDMYGPPAEDEPGLVGWWVPLDEGSGNTIHDKTLGNHGTLQVGFREDSYALAFDGVDDYVELSEMDHNYDNGFTVEAWVRFSDFKLNSRIIDFGNGFPQDNIIFANHYDSRNLVFQVYQDQTIKEIIAPDVLQENKWMHLAATVDNVGNAVIYVNGDLQVTGSIHKPLTVNRNMNYMGRSNWAQDGYFHGSMGEVRVWNVARNKTEIQANMHKLLSGKEEDLVGYWPLNEGSGSTIYDQTSKNTDGTLRVGADDDPNKKWGVGPIPPDLAKEKWIEGPDNPEEKWGKGPEDPKNKWVVVLPIAVLDFGVSRDGTLALIGSMENHSELILARKDGNNTADLSIPVLDKGNSQMGVIKVDQKGLTVSAGLLDYAHTGDTPFLLDGADGLVHLYFRGDYGNFLVTQLDTLTARVKYTMPLNGTETTDTGQVNFIAHQPGKQMKHYKISIVDGSNGDYCLVTMDSQNGIKEEWKEVPRNLELFLAVINGTAPSDANDPLVEEHELYDYDINVQREGVPDLTTGSNPFFGSTLFGVTADNLPDTGEPIPPVPNIEAVVRTEDGRDCAWIPEPKGKALQFDGTVAYVALPHEKLIIAGDLTVEAWVNIARSESSNGSQRLINYHSEDSRFTLGLVKNDNNYNVFAGSGEKAIQTDQIRVSPEEWTHLAAVYKATNALKLDGQGYVDCGNDVTLDMTEAMTVEAWVTPEKEKNERLQPEVVLSKWGITEEEQSWRLYIDTDDKPCFETRDHQRKLIRTKADAPLQAGQPYHLAGVFDASPREETALKFDKENDYVETPTDEVNLCFAGQITIEAWLCIRATDKERYILAHGDYTFLRILEGEYQFGGERKQDGPHAKYTIPLEDKNNWIHLAGVYDEQKWILYRNGIKVSEVSQSNGRQKKIDWWRIGRRDTLPSFKGDMNNVRIWHRALSEEEICENMDKFTLEGKEGLVGHWVFDEMDRLSVGSPDGKVEDRSGNKNHGTLKGGLDKDSFIDVDKCRYEQKILVDGELRGWRCVAIEEKPDGKVARARLTPSQTKIDLTVINKQVIVGDCLLLQDEQVLVTGVKKNQNDYELDVDRAVNGIAREHRRNTVVYFLTRKANKITSNTTKVNIGRSASDEWYFQGIVDDVRLWAVGRRDCQIQYYKDQILPGNAEGLVSHWRFEEGHGKIAIDAKGSNHGRLIHSESDKIEAMWTPVPRNASLILYVNGRAVQTSDGNFELDNFGGYGTINQFTIGAMFATNEAGETTQQFMDGCIDEVRIWSEVRSPEQIRDNMYRALSGAEENLAGYWPLDEGEGDAIQDQTGNGQEGTLKGPEWIDSTAPISNEGPEVRNVYDGIEKPGFNKQILGSPVAVEYGDMQWDADGNLFGVMKRCYIFPEDIIQLVTGFKVGDLELSFICQVQTAPTLIGYIEGAPPVPSENLTVNDPKTDDYVGNCSIELTEAKETIQLYSASRDTGFDMSVDTKVGYAWGTSAVSGFGFSVEVLDLSSKFGMHAYFEHSLGWLSGASMSAGISKTLTKSLVLGGGWEEKKDYDQNGRLRYLNEDVGRRYLPNNMGYALVKSATADLYALRMKQTGSLVAFQVMPNPDIPEDWNIIMFPLNPKYVKNGTLDGMVGLVADPDYLEAITGERGSYFKPLEAYALKEQIEREAENIRGYFESFRAGEIGRRQASTHFQEGDPGDASRRLLDLLPEGEIGYNWATGRDKRSMVNTYVWTADGGFYSEEEQFSSIRQESLGGSYSFLGKAGIYMEHIFQFSGGGLYLELDALFGGHINTTVSKSKEERAAFGLHVDVQGEGYLNKWEGDQDKQDGYYTAEPCPGKVDSYRFMTFYLAPQPDNFDKFFEQVVDPEWLNGQGKYAGEYGANARALREARSKPNQVWRVMHRVTYVSRIPPKFEPTPVEAVPKDVLRPANVQANIGLIQEIERIKRELPPGSDEETLLMKLGRAIDKLLGEPPKNEEDPWSQGELEEIISWWVDRDGDVKQEIRQNMMTYLKDFYLSDLTPPEIETDKQRVTEGLQVLYTFEEGTGKTVKDVSDVGTPMNLSIKNKDAVSWIKSGGLAIIGDTFVATSTPATKIIQAAKSSNEITVEAWIKPADAAQGKPAPARIVTLSSETGRNFMLGQYGERYLIRLRTTKTKDDGTDKELEAGNVTTDKLSHLVYVRDASGKAWFYLNGVEVDQHEVPGDFSNWDNSYRFGLSNEFTGALPRLWKGELHLVAIYNRALDQTEVMQNYKVGVNSRK